MAKFDPEEAKKFQVLKSEWEGDKQNRWEARTVRQLLSYLGVSGPEIKHMEQEQEEFTWSWFNKEMGFPVHFSSSRESNYNFESLMLGKDKHPIIQSWVNAHDSDPEKYWALIFRCAKFASQDDPKTFVITNCWPYEVTRLPFIGGIQTSEGYQLFVTFFKEYAVRLREEDYIRLD